MKAQPGTTRCRAIPMTNSELGVDDDNVVHASNDRRWFGSCRSEAQVRSGKWYYEVELLTPGLLQIGWATTAFSPSPMRGMGVGDYDKISWAYDGFRVQSLSGKETPGYGKRWTTGDVIGAAIDIDAGTVTFYHNGQSLGVAYTNVRLNGPEDAIFASVTLGSDQSCRMLFQREKMKYYPENEGYALLAVSFHQVSCQPCSISRFAPNGIIGPLHQCLTCLDFNMCEACSHKQKNMHDIEHLFITLPFPLSGDKPSVKELIRNAPQELLRGNNPYKYHPYRCADCGNAKLTGVLYISIPNTPTPNPAKDVVHLCPSCWNTRYRSDPRNIAEYYPKGPGLPGDVWLRSLALDLATELGFSIPDQELPQVSVTEKKEQESPLTDKAYVPVAYSNPMNGYYAADSGELEEKDGLEPQAKKKLARLQNYAKFYGAYSGDNESTDSQNSSIYSDADGVPTEEKEINESSIGVSLRNDLSNEDDEHREHNITGYTPAGAYGGAEAETQNLYQDREEETDSDDTDGSDLDSWDDSSSDTEESEEEPEPDDSRDWNRELQDLLDRIDATYADEDKLPLLAELRSLVREFNSKAAKIAQTIISEMSLPRAKKTYKPKTDMGGIAGGEKYMVDGIFFKFAIDLHQIYGGNAYALKAAGHELKGLQAYFFGKKSEDSSLPRLCVPIMTIIDYCGWRMIACCKLPIGKQTLCYGSADGGRSVHDKDPILSQLMKHAAEQINIKGHIAGPVPESSVLLYAPTDIEGHHGTDGRYYVVDTARVFPAEPSWVTFKALLLPPDIRKDAWSEMERPNFLEVDLTVQNWEKEIYHILSIDYSDLPPAEKAKQKLKTMTFSDATLVYSGRGPINHRASILAQCIIRGHALLNFGGFKGKSFHSLLRPEYVKSLDYPLSSDVWTLFGRHNAAIHNEEVHRATVHLQSVVIPRFAQELAAGKIIPLNPQQLRDRMHENGINMRYLGILRALLPRTKKGQASLLLVAIVTRCLKNFIRSALRTSPPEQHRSTIIQYLDLIFGQSPASNNYWIHVIKLLIQAKYRTAPFRPLIEKYGNCLTSEELALEYDLREQIRKLSLLLDLQQHLGFSFSADALNLIQSAAFFSGERPFHSLVTSLDKGEASCLLLPRTKQLFEPFLTNTICSTIEKVSLLAVGAGSNPVDTETLEAMKKCERLTASVYGEKNRHRILRLAKLADGYLRANQVDQAKDCCAEAFALLTQENEDKAEAEDEEIQCPLEVMITLAHTAGDVYNKAGDAEMAKMYYIAALNGLDRLMGIDQDEKSITLTPASHVTFSVFASKEMRSDIMTVKPLPNPLALIVLNKLVVLIYQADLSKGLISSKERKRQMLLYAARFADIWKYVAFSGNERLRIQIFGAIVPLPLTLLLEYQYLVSLEPYVDNADSEQTEVREWIKQVEQFGVGQSTHYLTSEAVASFFNEISAPVGKILPPVRGRRNRDHKVSVQAVALHGELITLTWRAKLKLSERDHLCALAFRDLHRSLGRNADLARVEPFCEFSGLLRNSRMLVDHTDEELSAEEQKTREDAGGDQRMFTLQWYHRRWDYSGQIEIDLSQFEAGIYHFVLAVRDRGLSVLHCSRPLLIRSGLEKEEYVIEWLKGRSDPPPASTLSVHKPRALQDISHLVPLIHVQQVACSISSTLLLTTDHRVFAWGRNACGELGLGDQDVRSEPTEVLGLAGKTIVQLSITAVPWQDEKMWYRSGSIHSMALSATGVVYTWGTGNFGELGTADKSSTLTPFALESMRTKIVVQICAGANSSLALTKSGEVWQWGYRLNDKTGEDESTATPYRVEHFDEPIVHISTGYRTYAAVDRLGFVYMWGHMPEPNNIRQTVTSSVSGTTEHVLIRKKTQEHYVRQPIRLESAVNHFVVDVQLGDQFALMLTDEGRVLAFGEHPNHARGIEDFHYSISSTLDPSVVRPPHLVDLLNGRPYTRVVNIVCEKDYAQLLTAEGDVYYWGGDSVYLPRRLTLPSFMRVRRMYPGIAICDGSIRRNDPADYSPFAKQLFGLDVDISTLHDRQEQHRKKLKEEWSVLSTASKIEVREKKERKVIVNWRCPVWWMPHAIEEDYIALRPVTATRDSLPNTEGRPGLESDNPSLGYPRFYLRDSIKLSETTGQGALSFGVPFLPEGQYEFVYVRKLPNTTEERAFSQPLTLDHGSESASLEDALFTFPLKPLNFTKMQSFVQCAPINACAKLILKDLRKVASACNDKSMEQDKIIQRSLLLCEDYTRNSVWHFAAKIGRVECLILFSTALRKLYPQLVASLTKEQIEAHLHAAITKANRQGLTPLDLARSAGQAGQRASVYLRSSIARGDSMRRGKEKEDDGDRDNLDGLAREFAEIEERLIGLLDDLRVTYVPPTL